MREGVTSDCMISDCMITDSYGCWVSVLQDKVNMSIAIRPMAEDFGWSSSVSGIIQSSFFYGYVLGGGGGGNSGYEGLSVIHIGRCRRIERFRFRWSPSHSNNKAITYSRVLHYLRIFRSSFYAWTDTMCTITNIYVSYI